MVSLFLEVPGATMVRRVTQVNTITAVAMCCFAFSTIIGWGLYGARCIEFIFLMAIPNLIAVFLLSGTVFTLVREYLGEK